MNKINLYIDCTSGVSGDMLCRGLTELCGDAEYVKACQAALDLPDHSHPHIHDHADTPHAHTDTPHAHSHTRSFREIEALIREAQLEEDVIQIALDCFLALALAEAEVHGETLDTVHFHEVGRPHAIRNMVGIAAAIKMLQPTGVFVTEIHDGVGMVQCSHGLIPVTVPAVCAMMKQCDFQFVSEEVNMEMVTPTGLAGLIGIQAKHVDTIPSITEPAAKGTGIVKTAFAVGTRVVARGSGNQLGALDASISATAHQEIRGLQLYLIAE